METIVQQKKEETLRRQKKKDMEKLKVFKHIAVSVFLHHFQTNHVMLCYIMQEPRHL